MFLLALIVSIVLFTISFFVKISLWAVFMPLLIWLGVVLMVIVVILMLVIRCGTGILDDIKRRGSIK